MSSPSAIHECGIGAYRLESSWEASFPKLSSRSVCLYHDFDIFSKNPRLSSRIVCLYHDFDIGSSLSQDCLLGLITTLTSARVLFEIVFSDCVFLPRLQHQLKISTHHPASLLTPRSRRTRRTIYIGHRGQGLDG